MKHIYKYDKIFEELYRKRIESCENTQCIDDIIKSNDIDDHTLETVFSQFIINNKFKFAEHLLENDYVEISESITGILFYLTNEYKFYLILKFFNLLEKYDYLDNVNERMIWTILNAISETDSNIELFRYMINKFNSIIYNNNINDNDNNKSKLGTLILNVLDNYRFDLLTIIIKSGKIVANKNVSIEVIQRMFLIILINDRNDDEIIDIVHDEINNDEKFVFSLYLMILENIEVDRYELSTEIIFPHIVVTRIVSNLIDNEYFKTFIYFFSEDYKQMDLKYFRHYMNTMDFSLNEHAFKLLIEVFSDCEGDINDDLYDKIFDIVIESKNFLKVLLSLKYNINNLKCKFKEHIIKKFNLNDIDDIKILINFLL